jgi:hypothetical protein
VNLGGEPYGARLSAFSLGAAFREGEAVGLAKNGTIMAVKVINEAGRAIDYRLNILGVRVWENCCQLVAKSCNDWGPIGPRWDLPISVPQNAEELKLASADTLRMTAYQYDVERPGSDLVEVLSKRKNFSAACKDASAAAASEG